MSIKQIKTKFCPSCKIEKDSSFFSIDRRTRSGLHGYCKKCKTLKYNIRCPRFCKCCNEQILNERRHRGAVFCSNTCRRIHANKLNIIRKDKLGQRFANFKLKIKCCICNYDKFGGSLDFHHINPKEKDRKIPYNITSFNLIKDEIEKCVLVCKNCHYELHNLIRIDANKYLNKIQEIKNIFNLRYIEHKYIMEEKIIYGQ